MNKFEYFSSFSIWMLLGHGSNNIERMNGYKQRYKVYLGFVAGLATKVVVRNYAKIIEVWRLEDGDNKQRSQWLSEVKNGTKPDDNWDLLTRPTEPTINDNKVFFYYR